MDIETGISIVMNHWVQVQPEELIHFITDENHMAEAKAMERWAVSHGAILKTTVLPSQRVQCGDVLEGMNHQLSVANVIIGATDYSFITTDAVRQATAKGARFLSLPLSCADGSSILEQDFIAMNTHWTSRAAKALLRRLNHCDAIRVVTKAGTDLRLCNRGRKGACFNGVAGKKGSLSSASFECCIPIVETGTNGDLWLDASLGYLGGIRHPFPVSFHDGRLSCTANSPDALRLREYIESFHDPKMWYSAEFGIGLNTIARCRGISYIEDESSYGTFHIGMGRNLALGGQQDAAGHFDIIADRPTIYAGDVMVMREGRVIY